MNMIIDFFSDSHKEIYKIATKIVGRATRRDEISNIIPSS